jgi:NADPH:quinone reductase-like Zn-dependent oxidoreductase
LRVASTSREVAMKAFALSSFDEPAAVIEVDDPIVQAGEVLVRVAAASLNPYDAFVASGAAKSFMEYAFPAVLGGDVAGTVEALGDDVDGFAVGDRVFGMMGMKGSVHDGSFAERTTPQAGAVAKTPQEVSDTDAGSLGVAGTTAVSAVDAVDVRDGARVLIVGATGGVGSFAMQLARLGGAHVIASVRPGDEDFVTGLGAAETVDYTGDIVEAIRDRYPDGVDAAIDLVNRDEDFQRIVSLVRKGGHAASALGAAAGEEIDGVRTSNANGNPANLLPIAALVAEGKVRVAVTRTYRLDDAAQALRDLTDEHTLGKLVIEMR